jgi:mRNA interferase RelE/StbE
LSKLFKCKQKVVEDLRDVDKKSATGLIDRVKKYLPQNPISLGKPLHREFKGLYRYRYGRYRVLYAIDRKENTILILRVGKRKEIYNKV